MTNKGLFEFLVEHCGVKAANKHIPSFIFTASSNVKRAFVDAYFNGDGCHHYTYGLHKGYSRDSKTVSKTLATELFYLLLQLGINPRFQSEKPRKKDFGTYISNCKESYSVSYSNRSIVDADGFRGNHKKKRKIGDLSQVRITKIELVSSSSKFVYDLSVSGQENFVGGLGMALHNTGEGGAILTNNGRLFNIVRSYANWGRDCWCKPGESNTCGKRFEQQFYKLPFGYDHKYVTSRIGYNMKMTELQAVLGTSQMSRIKNIVHARRMNHTYLKTNLSAIPLFDDKFILFRSPVLSSPFGFPIILKSFEISIK